MSFRRTVQLLQRHQPSIHQQKWWGKHSKVDGLVTQHLSPFEQNVTGSLFKDFQKKIIDKVVGFLLEAGPGLAFGLGVYTWGNWEYERTHYNHRP